MANNILPTNSAQIIGLAQKMHTGIVQLGVEIPIVMLTAGQIQTDLDAFIAANTNYDAARSARLAVSESFQTQMEAVYEWLLAVSNVLASRYGVRWSTAWAQAGFTNHSTGIPRKIEEQLGLVLSLVRYFTANPGFEVPSMNLTAARGTVLRDEALARQQAGATATMNLKTTGDVWTAAYEKLVGAMRALIKNLEGKLAKDDPRWLAFGLNMPATPATPGRPQEVTVQADESGSLVVQCAAVPLATRYRWRTLLAGVQTEYVLAARSTEPMAVIREVAPGQTVQLVVQAVNGALQGVASEPVTFTLPLAAKAAGYRSLAPADESEKTAAHGNGNGNGHGGRPRLAGATV